MLAWIIASPQCNHWNLIESAIKNWRSRRRYQSVKQRRHQRHKNLTHVIIDPQHGPFAEKARQWAARLNLQVVDHGQPDVLFLCHAKPARPSNVANLVKRFNPGHVIRITGHGRFQELPVSREPSHDSHPALALDMEMTASNGMELELEMETEIKMEMAAA